MAFTIKVNGNTHSVDGDTPLLWVLRDAHDRHEVRLRHGAARGLHCARRRRARSCVTPVDGIGASEITTIEAIGATAAGARIQKAWSIVR